MRTPTYRGIRAVHTAAAIAAAAGVVLLMFSPAFAQATPPAAQAEPAPPGPAPSMLQPPGPPPASEPGLPQPPEQPAPAPGIPSTEPSGPEPPPPPLPPASAPPPPVAVAAVAPASSAERSDHAGVVGRWGLEGRRLAAFERTPGQERGCEAVCPIVLDSLGLRHWVSPRLAWSAGLAFTVGGGSGVQMGDTRTWDTHLGGGPTGGLSFLLAESRHLAISAGPQLDLIGFMPSENGSKSFLVNLRGIVEAELHFGFIGFPDASVSASGGLQASFLKATRDDRAPMEGATRSKWGADLFGPQAPWDLITRTQLRYYF